MTGIGELLRSMLSTQSLQQGSFEENPFSGELVRLRWARVNANDAQQLSFQVDGMAYTIETGGFPNTHGIPMSEGYITCR